MKRIGGDGIAHPKVICLGLTYPKVACFCTMVLNRAARWSSCGEFEEYRTETGRIDLAGLSKAGSERRRNREADGACALWNNGMAQQAQVESSREAAAAAATRAATRLRVSRRRATARVMTKFTRLRPVRPRSPHPCRASTEHRLRCIFACAPQAPTSVVSSSPAATIAHHGRHILEKGPRRSSGGEDRAAVPSRRRRHVEGLRSS